MPKAYVRPVRVHVPSRDLETTVVRGVGFRWKCDCGERGRTVSSRASAVAGAREHRVAAHGG